MHQRLNYDAEQLLLNEVRERALEFHSGRIEPEHLIYAALDKEKLNDCFDSERSRSKLILRLKRFFESITDESVSDPPYSQRYRNYLDILSGKLALLPNGVRAGVPLLFRTAAETADSICRPLLENGNLVFFKANETDDTVRRPVRETEEDRKKEEFLSLFSKDMVAEAKRGEGDPIIGREKEIERVMKILSRRRKNNPILLGEPGVGKTALVEGLAQRIAAGNVPEGLQNRRILYLDMGAIVAGTKYRGEFEDRLKKLLQVVMEKGNIILFIDEIHTIVGAGGSEGAIDAANILKPPLSRGELQCIGATTVKEYRRRIEKDSALERRFQNVYIDEPDEEATKKILYGIVGRYADHHHVVYTGEAVETAVNASQRYITERFQPDKSIDLLDEAGAEKRIRQSEKPKTVVRLEEKIRQRKLRKNVLVDEQRFEEAAKERDRIKRLEGELAAAVAVWHRERSEERLPVTADDILRVVSTATGIPAEKLAESEAHRLLHLEEELNRVVIGQDKAVAAVASAIRRSRVGFASPQRPSGSFLFLGPTGVGKTYLAKTLAETLFGSSDALIRVDMSDYMEKHNVSKLVGAPPGYVGFEEGGMLSGMVRRRPYCVVLLDEIEKAHPDVFNLLLQVLEEGELIDSLGHKVSFRNAVIIMTSNLGSKDLNRAGQLGFSQEKGWKSYAEIKQSAMAEAKRFLAPEFINRLDEIVVFDSLKEPQIRQIADLLCRETVERLAKNGITLKIAAAVRDELVATGFDPVYGARTMRRAIRTRIEDPLALECLRHPEADKVECRMQKGEIVFRLTAGTAPTPPTENTETAKEQPVHEL